jgi:hypothetical protein
MKTKDKMLQVVNWWYSDTADLRQKHALVVVMKEKAGETSVKKLWNSLPLWE